MSKRYEFNITRTQEFIVGIEAEDEWEAREIFDELNSDDFGDPVNSVLEIKWVFEEEPIRWKKDGNLWLTNLTSPVVTIKLNDNDEYWLHIYWSQTTMYNAKYWSLDEAKFDAERKVRNFRLKVEDNKNG